MTQNKTMRIGIDVSQIVYDGTGSATYTKELLHALLKQDTTNEYVLFAGTLRQQQKLKAFLCGLPRQVASKFTYIPPLLLNILWNELHFIPIETFTGTLDIFHASDATQPPSKCLKVTTVHDLVVYHYPETLHPKQVQVQKKRLAWVKKDADKIIAVSESTKNDLVKLLEIPEEKIAVIYEAASPRFNRNVRENKEVLDKVKQKYKLPEKFLLYVGALQPRKNLPRLLEAYKKLKNPMPLVIAGKFGWGTVLPAILNVKNIGFVEDIDLPSLYALSYSLVYPALYEGFGLPILEAMACGTPVVTANTSSMPEVGGTAPLYVDPNDIASIFEGMQEIITMPQERYLAMQENSLLQAQKFSWEKTAQETLTVYNMLV